MNFAYISEGEYKEKFENNYEECESQGIIKGKAAFRVFDGSTPVVLLLFILNIACSFTIGTSEIVKTGIKLIKKIDRPILITKDRICEGK